MSEWKTTELGNVITLKRGYDLPQQKRNSGLIPIFSSSGVSGSHNTAMVKAPGVITGRYGTIGQVFYADTDFWPLNTTLYVEDFHGNDPHFIYYFLKTLAWEKFTSASAIPGINRNTVHKEIVRIPDVETQKAIAKYLLMIDEKIKNNEQINDNLEQQAITIFNELAKSSDSKKPLSEFIKIKHGYAFKGDYISTEDNGIVLVTPGNFCIGGGFKENKCKYFTGDYPNDYVLQPNSLIVTMTDLSKEADTLGYSALVPQSSERVYLHNQRIGLVEPINTDIPLSYVYWYMRSYEYHMSIVGSASGSTVKHTSPGRISEQHIPIPDKNSLEQYAAILDNINTIVSRNNAENTYLHSLREALLPKLMSGEISVDDAVF